MNQLFYNGDKEDLPFVADLQSKIEEDADRNQIEFKILIAPSAKFSALEIEYKTGNSITKSTPFERTILVFSHLLIIEVEPRCTKLPLIIAIE